MTTNPALTLYRYWREVIRFYSESKVRELRKQTFGRDQQNVDAEKYSVSARSYSRSSNHAPINYRISLALTGVSVRHLERGMIEPFIEEYEPVITMNVHGYRDNRIPIMTLYPNGDFKLDDLPSSLHQLFSTMTFFQTTYAAGKRVWLLPENEKEDGSRPWASLNEKDWGKHRLYVPNFSFISGCSYRLVHDKKGIWKFASTNASADPNEIRAAKLLAEGYQACEDRYTRHERTSKRNPVPIKQLSIHIPKVGRITGDEAIAQVVHHLRVYPALTPLEAPNGCNDMVSSAIHPEARLVTG